LISLCAQSEHLLQYSLKPKSLHWQAVTKRAVLKERCSGSGAPFLFSVDGVWVLS
jgi:hypothetical protein